MIEPHRKGDTRMAVVSPSILVIAVAAVAALIVIALIAFAVVMFVRRSGR